MKFSKESQAMSFFRRMGFDRSAWALRRFHTPVDKQALVLEVGAGGNPYPRANVLLDAYEETRERHWAPLVADRPTVLGFAENLPFKDHAFDFVIAAHVLEHSTDPDKFLSELQRVAKAGYIEVPDAFMERINPYKDHRSEITCRNEELIIRKKANWRLDPELIELYEDRAKLVLTSDLIPRHPFEFHVRHYWTGQIAYKVVNPDVDAAWRAPPGERSATTNSFGNQVRQWLRNFLRGLFSQRRRNEEIDLLPLLRCTVCHSTALSRKADGLRCGACGADFATRRGVMVMNEGQ